MSIRIKSTIGQPFALCHADGSDFVITAQGKHAVTLVRDGEHVTIAEVGPAS